MRKVSNKKLGSDFEKELANKLSYKGFWVHLLTQSDVGQPADIIAARNGKPLLIDCKVCSNDQFHFNRIEDNQINAMKLWNKCGNGNAYFALKLTSGKIYIITLNTIKGLVTKGIRTLGKKEIEDNTLPFDEWVKYK